MKREKPIMGSVLTALAIAVAVWATMGPPRQGAALPIKLAVGR